MSTVKDGTYRFQCLANANGDDYFTLKTSGLVQGSSYDPSTDNQKWTVKKRLDGAYDIANVRTGGLLFVASPSGGETAHTLKVGGDVPMSWDFDTAGSKIKIKGTGSFAGKVADLSDNDRIILWDSYDGPNQTWFLEVVDTTLPPPPPPVPEPKWVATQRGNIPAGALQGGWQVDGRPLYVARAYFSEDATTRPGQAAPQLPGYCRISFSKGERTFDSYEVLVADPGTVRWVPFPPGEIDPTGVWAEGQTRLKPLVAGTLSNKGSLFVIRCMDEKNLLIGSGLTDSSWVGLNGRRYIVSDWNCEVLCYAK